MEEPWGLFAPLLLGGSVTSLGASSTCLGNSAVLLGSLEYPSWAPVAPAWPANCLSVIVISDGSSHCFLGTTIASCLGSGAVRGRWSLTCLGDIAILLGNNTVCLGARKALSLVEYLTTRGEAWFARETLLSNWEVTLSAWEALSLVECLNACLPEKKLSCYLPGNCFLPGNGLSWRECC